VTGVAIGGNGQHQADLDMETMLNFGKVSNTIDLVASFQLS
jgi:hypothetical protein